MSWSGTVRCGHCYETGHNKRSCPKLKEYVENNPDSWRAKMHVQSAAKGKLRRCTYCNLKAHNRRTCEHLNTDKATWIAKTREWREGFVEWVAETGLTPGALVRSPDPVTALPSSVVQLLTFQYALATSGFQFQDEVADCPILLSRVLCANLQYDTHAVSTQSFATRKTRPPPRLLSQTLPNA